MGIGASGFGVQPEDGLRPTEFRPSAPFIQAQDLELIKEWSTSQAEAGKWLQGNSSTQDLLVTNITFSPLVPALSGRQTFISGISHQAPYGRASLLNEILKRETASLEFINNPSSTSFAAMCSIGAKWVWVDRTRTPDANWEPYASIAFTSPDTLILRTNPGAC